MPFFLPSLTRHLGGVFRGSVLVLGVILTLALAPVRGQTPPADLLARATQLASGSRNLVKLVTIGKTPNQQPIWALEITTNPAPTQTPGVAVVAGVDVRYASTPEMALRIAERIVAQANVDSVKRWLATNVLYIVPIASPDAYARAFLLPGQEVNRNTRSTDEDHDGLLDEDPAEDMNTDGLITWMRVRDSSGQWLPHPDDPRVMVRANTALGHRGLYSLYPEGTDTDRDQRYNEDGLGGVAFNRNWSHGYVPFVPEHGPNPVSEPETRLLADYFYERLNIQLVMVLGPQNTLSKPWTHDPGRVHPRVPVTIAAPDQPGFALFSKIHNGLGFGEYTEVWPDELGYAGSFLHWAYYHYGRWAVGTPGHWWPVVKFEADTTRDSLAGVILKRRLESESPEVRLLASVPDTLPERWGTPWLPIQHPDFPGRVVEIGGWRPYQRFLIPADSMETAANRNADFLLGAGNQLARVALRNVRIAKRADGIYVLEFEVQNTGTLPTLATIADRNAFVKLLVARLTLGENQRLLAGSRVTKLPTLAGGAIHRLEFLIQGTGNVKIDVGAQHLGTQTRTVTLN